MIQREEQLVQTLFEHGFDLWSPVCDIAERFPKQNDYGVAGSEIIPFRLRIPLLGETWKIPINRPVDLDLPPLRYCHEFHPTRDPRENHAQAEAQWIGLLGQGEAGAATNVYERHWRIGFFSIRVITWPRELNRRSSNVFEGKNPNLWISANSYIEPDFPFIEPTEDGTVPLRVVIREGLGCTLDFRSLVYARRNRVPSRSSENVAGLDGGNFTMRSHDRSVVVPLGDIQSVKHVRMTPGRFSGSSSLDIEAIFLNRHKVSVAVARGERTDSLDQIASSLAEALQKRLETEEYSDDG